MDRWAPDHLPESGRKGRQGGSGMGGKCVGSGRRGREQQEAFWETWLLQAVLPVCCRKVTGHANGHWVLNKSITEAEGERCHPRVAGLCT